MGLFENRQQTLSLLHTFSVAAKHLSFTLAADELFLTQGGVSHRIKKLEQQLKFNLFVRKTRKLELTPEGQRVLAMLNVSFESIFSELVDIQTGELSGELYIATSPYFASSWLMPRLPEFRKLYPNLSIKLQTKQNQSDFQFEPYDVAIFYSEGHYPNHYNERLFNGVRTPVCSPEYAKQFNLKKGIEHLGGVRFIHNGDITAWQRWLHEAQSNANCALQCDYYSDNRLAMDAAMLSMGVALGRLEFMKPQIEQGLLVAPLMNIESGKGYDLVCPKGMEQRTKFQVFTQWVKQQL
ncbi:LysR family transcriptional regulator, glycine cleavage system transcriptional activator [Vibrio crassostreae]|uniref:LysR substrate-binding domain-containing protein n=1 Tax=Vibrio crassostreae TaxID=246167 RepID=UPI00063076E8|nr:LysR substrate-binding domain-containing protein [Vibrio crassostreae]TCT56870.1 transcriptional regulator [Vibrio crassostreae]TCT69235.1 transcriptional regulator [Vibrio crassostreae]TCT77386.1 transcriptional regulator [Vibrio crassostreae]TCT80687.1 transcriptional regulator [Vibrio crassostreae]TCT99306.1 transcriptional regulator [Vibrio crassostreae]